MGGGRRGVLITFEGGEGSGKSTQARLLARELEGMGLRCLLVREPGGTPFGEGLREVVFRSEGLDPVAEAMAFVAARAELVAKVLAPALADGACVVCDRYVDSTLAYQGYGLGLDVSFLHQLNARAARGTWPDLTFLLDLSAEQGLGRTADGRDAIARRPLDFHERVRRGYLELAAREARFRVVDAGRPVEEVFREVRERTVELLARTGVLVR